MDNEQKNTNNHKQTTEPAADFHGAALIDADGNEIPITEDMVQGACTNLDETEGSSKDKK
jgi:hypothetical protein